MPDNIHIRILHHIQIPLRILQLRSRLHTRNMQTRNHHIHLRKCPLRQIHRPLRIQNIHLRPQKQLNPIHLPRHNLKIIKVILMTSPRHHRRMLRNPKHLKPLLRSRLRHLPQRTIRMPASHRMCMQIQHRIIFHNSPSPHSYKYFTSLYVHPLHSTSKFYFTSQV